MTNEKLWVIDRIKRCANFDAELTDVSMHIHDEDKQREALKEVHWALEELVKADSAVIAKGGK